jgi:hypothetical protein
MGRKVLCSAYGSKMVDKSVPTQCVAQLTYCGGAASTVDVET